MCVCNCSFRIPISLDTVPRICRIESVFIWSHVIKGAFTEKENEKMQSRGENRVFTLPYSSFLFLPLHCSFPQPFCR